MFVCLLVDLSFWSQLNYLKNYWFDHHETGALNRMTMVSKNVYYRQYFG